MDIEAQAQAADRALSALRQAVQTGKESKKKAPPVAEQQKQIAACEKSAQRVKTALESYKLEIRVLPKEQQAEHLGRIREIEEGLRQARAQIDWKRLDAETARSAGNGPASAAAEVDEGPVTLEQAQVEASRVQDASKASVARSLGMVLQAEQVGIATLEKMHVQDEQMARIGEEVEDIKANIKRSRKLVGQIARGAARDRCIQMLCALITISIMVCITLAVTGKDDGELNVPDPVRQAGD